MLDFYEDDYEPGVDSMAEEIMDAMEDDCSIDDSDERDIDYIAGITDEDVDNLVVEDEEIDSIGDDEEEEEDNYSLEMSAEDFKDTVNNNINNIRNMEEDLV